MKYMLGLLLGCILSLPIVGQNTLSYSSFNELVRTIQEDKENIIILNFWATWCKPCVAELPDFEKIQAEYKNKKVVVILANLDLHSKTESTVPVFMVDRNILSKVVHITDQDPNSWINEVDINWSGSIPATAIYYQGEKKWFLEGQTNYEELKTIINKYITQ